MTKHRTFFSVMGASILVLVAAAKLVSAAGHAGVLDTPDDMLLVPRRWVLVGVGSIELLAAAVVLFSRSRPAAPYVFLWLGLCFAGYRVAHAMGQFTQPCSCLGTVTDSLPLSPETVTRLLLGVIAYFIAGGAYFAFWDRGSRPVGGLV